ncbi:gephyrin-like molybdotransferase Glp [Methylocapsa palsarum]|uniref:Molybdopterin molybdenumtransferase n=1 Tax=Methylocapsa palsarum TaxID=1612308 RepID=A0A1I3WSX6_9HYPH|nr:gephyrin-like molybdotransferase Glp [Methylocapsa palsarum]SFK10592.1 molybdopterin molybdotransferase [Methylocapsa palsarum]
MAQLSKDSFSAGDALMPVGAAVALLFDRVSCVEGVEALRLNEAEGRILARALTAPIDLPAFDNSAVDGYAVRFCDLSPGVETCLPVEGRAAAGHATEGGGAGKAVRIFTGAAMPEGLDTVFMQEDCRLLPGDLASLPPGLAKGANRRLRGEDISAGAQALAAGRRLRPEDLGLAAALGVDRLTVRRRLKAAIFSTGDEILEPGTPMRPAGVYDANRFVLHGLLKRQGVEVTDLGVLADNQGEIAAALRSAAADHDLVLTSGGVSAGEEDHVKAAISNSGSLVFWRLGIKPGRPVAMGVIEGTPFVGLPGNPVAVFVTFVYVVRPLIAALSGAQHEPARPLPVTSGFEYRKKTGRREYVRVTLRAGAAGEAIAEKHPVEGAGVLTSLTRTHGFVELGEDVTRIAAGDKVAYIDYDMIR